jgi:hypothetical protein
VSRLIAASVFLSVGLTLVQPATAQRTNPKMNRQFAPPKLVGEGSATPLKVVLLRGWGFTTGWSDLKTEWPKFGNIPLIIDDTTYIGSAFTYADLVNSKADVIVLSNPAGGSQKYSSDEVAAVERYVSEGHPVLGTGLVFEWSGVDNRSLMPLFGLNRNQSYTQASADSKTFLPVGTPGCLLAHLPTPWRSQGYDHAQAPQTASENWTPSSLDLATVVAQSDNRTGIVTFYNAGTYEGVFISIWPEYYGGINDLQLLYNAVTCYASQGQ